MHRLVRAAFIGSVLLCGCPGEDKPTCGDLDTTPIARNKPTSFANDVVPIFKLSCNFSNCHGSSLSSNGLYLADTNVQRLHGTIVGVPSQHLAAMPYVTAGNPDQSYLQRKIDNTHCQLNAQCKDGDCGLSMPYNDVPLDAPTRNIVRAWITEGAQNN